jgi:subtilisin family serine protease
MDCLDPKAAGLLPLAADTGLDFAATSTVGQLSPDPFAGALGEVSILAALTGEASASTDLYKAATTTTGVLSAGDSITGFVNVLRDHDWFKITLTAGQTYTFNQNAINGSSLDSFLALRNSAGTLLASNDDSNGSRNSEILFTASSTGTYYLDAGASRDRSVGQYQLSATQLVPPPGYSATTGYGEASVERAIEKLLNATFPAVADQFAGGGLYGLDRLGAPEVWAAGYTGKGMVVAVVDTGVDRNHVDLDANTWVNAGEVEGDGIDNDGNGFVDDRYGWNFNDGNANTLDNNNHGTHVAGTIAAENNGFGATGVAYDAKIMAVKVLGANGSGSLANVAAGIRYAANNGANVINLSLGSTSGGTDLQSAVQYAWSKGVAVMMAAGNDGAASPGYPAAYATQYGMAIGAIDSAGSLASFSNRSGTTPLDYVSAAGVAVYSTLPGNTYGTYSGTSMATPHMAGAMALLMQANQQAGTNRTLAELETLFTSTASNSVAAAVSLSGSSGATGSASLASVLDLPATAAESPRAAAAAQAAAPAVSLMALAVQPASQQSGASAAVEPDSPPEAGVLSGDASGSHATAGGAGSRSTGPADAAIPWLLAAQGSAGVEEQPLLDPLTGIWAQPWQHRS